MEDYESIQYDLQVNLESFRTDTLQILIYINQIIFVGWLFLFMSRINTGSANIIREAIPLVWFGVTTIGAWVYHQRNRYRSARTFFFAALIGAPVFSLFVLDSFRSFMAYSLILSVMLAGVLSGPMAPFKISMSNIGIFIGLGLLNIIGVVNWQTINNFSDYISFFLGPMLLHIIIAMTSWLATRDLVSTVQWAMESNRLAERRAERLGVSENRVARTLLELEGAYDVQKRLNQQLQELNEELEIARASADEANTLKTRFLANMSHELRTPLNAIINFTQFMTKPRYGDLTDRQKELQERVLVNSEHLLGLINDILDLSKIEAGRMQLQIESIDLKPIIHGVMATAVGLTKSKGLETETDIDEDLPLVRGDKVRVRQILLNLISNGAKFTDTGIITLKAMLVDSMVQISVWDTGNGIPESELPLVFEEFHQVEQAASAKRQQGTGLGLPISRHLVMLQGGDMWAESTIGEGSVFYFTLPVEEEERQPEIVIFDPETQLFSS